MPKKYSGIDRKSIYVPQPERWIWDKLSEDEIARRLASATESRRKITAWISEVTIEREAKRKEVWAGLGDAKLQSYTKTGGWKVNGQEELEAMGQDLRTLKELQRQTTAAIAAIEDHGKPQPVLLPGGEHG